MSDLEVRRLTRELLRTGLDVEAVLDTVLAELKATRSTSVLVEHQKLLSVDPAFRPALSGERVAFLVQPPRVAIQWTIKALRLPPIEASDPSPGDAEKAERIAAAARMVEEVAARAPSSRESGYCGRCGDMTTTGNPCESCRHADAMSGRDE